MRAWIWMTMVGLSPLGCVRAWSPPPLECDTDADCAEGQRCLAIKYEVDAYEEGALVYRSRVGSFACTERTTCGLELGGCGPGEACDSALVGSCFVPECTATDLSGCGGFGCDLSTNRCRSSCDGYYEPCAAGHYCGAAGCRPFECGGDPREVCGGYACVEEACLASCATDEDCVAGYWCKSGLCQGTGTDGDACFRSLDCAETHYCDDYSASCEALREGGESCSTDGHCASGSCVEDALYGGFYCAYLAIECVGCSSAQYCDERTGACQPKRSAEASCDFGEQCLTGECVSGGFCAGGAGDDCSVVDCAAAFTCTYEYDEYEYDYFSVCR